MSPFRNHPRRNSPLVTPPPPAMYSVPRGFKLEFFWPAVGGPWEEGGPSQPPPPPLQNYPADAHPSVQSVQSVL